MALKSTGENCRVVKKKCMRVTLQSASLLLNLVFYSQHNIGTYGLHTVVCNRLVT